MFTQQIVESDDFTDLPISSQALYFHLCMNADDDGFVNSTKKVIAFISATEQDLNALLSKRFLLRFPSGVIVIKHWKMANSIPKDRYKPTVYQEEYAMLTLKENGAYTEKVKPVTSSQEPCKQALGNPVTSFQEPCIQGSENPVTQSRLDKNRLDKISVEESGPRAEETYSEKKKFHPPTLEEVVEYCKERKSPVDPIRFYDFFSAGHWKDIKGNSVRNWKQKLISWERDEKGKGQKKEKPHTFTPTNFD